MRIAVGDGTHLLGPLDVAFIARNIDTGRFHVIVFEEKPMPGPVPDTKDTKLVRLRSSMHHTEGAETLEAAQVHMAQIREKLKILDANVCQDVSFDWDGQAETIFTENWTLPGGSVKAALEQALRVSAQIGTSGR